LATEVGASPSTLIRAFKQMFGLPPHAYHARVRLRHGLSELRNGPTKVADAGRAAGYASSKNFNRAARHYTGLKPSEVRALSEPMFGRLLTDLLCVDPDVLRKRKATWRPREAGRF
jgi:AraC family transcriptional regulator